MEILSFVSDREVGSMDNIVRFGMERTIKDENLSSHSWWVVLFSYLFTLKLCIASQDKKNSILLRVLIKALTHDMDEMFTDDISHDVKYNAYNGNDIKSKINEYAHHKFLEKFAAIPELAATVKNGHSGEEKWIVDDIAKVGDWLACIKYVVSEIGIGNKSMENILAKCIVKLKEHLKMFYKELLQNNDMFAETYDHEFLPAFIQEIDKYYETHWKYGKYSE